MSPALFLSAERLKGVHGLRGCAALGIVLFHQQAIPRLPLPHPLADVVAHLYLSVLFFFALSAFTLAHSSTVTHGSYAAYLVKRFFRIAPLFYAAILWNLCLIPLPSASTLLANFTFTFNLIPGLEQSLVWAGWSVGVEVMAYLVLPAILIVSGGVSRAAMVFCAFTLLSIALWTTFAADSTLPLNYAYFFVGSNLAAFSAGVLAYRFFIRYFGVEGRGIPAVLGSVSAGMMATLFFDPLNLHFRSPGLYFGIWAFAFSIACTWQALAPAGVLKMGFVQWLGDRSFSIYLLHPVIIEFGKPAYKWVAALGMGALPTYVGCLVLTLPVLFALAELTYRFIELPGIRAGSRIARSIDRGRHLQSLVARDQQALVAEVPTQKP